MSNKKNHLVMQGGIMQNIKGGSRVWYVADGWMPLKNATKDAGYEGHEAIMILNSSNKGAKKQDL
jgi:hypothetical protein